MFFGSPHLRWYFEQLSVIDVSALKGMELIRAGVIYMFAQSAYVHNHGQDKATVIPRSLAIPVVTIAEKLRMPPILSYYFYCLNNWRFLGDKDDFNPDNLHTIQNFIYDDCENWFIVIHVGIEHHAGEGLAALVETQQAIYHDNIGQFTNYMENAALALEKMIKALKRMPERCSPEDYYHRVRPQIYGFNDVIYEGVDKFQGKPQTFRGETGAQSAAIPAFKKFLGIHHSESALTVHLEDMLHYMRPAHVYFLNTVPDRTLQNSSIIREYAKKLRAMSAYNDCVRRVHEFEEIHFSYAVDYIQKRVSDPNGTGGTPYIEWLSKMKDETLSFLLY